MSRYEPSRKEVNDSYWRSKRREEAEDRYYQEHPQTFLERLGEVGWEVQEFHREFTKRSPF